MSVKYFLFSIWGSIYLGYNCSVAEPEPVEPKFFGDLKPETEPKINLNKHFLQVSLEDARTKKS